MNRVFAGNGSSKPPKNCLARTLLLLNLWLLLPLAAQSQPRHEAGRPFIRNYSPQEYSAHVQNQCIVQDDRGVIYIANASGVLEYDGVSWRLIPSTSNSFIRSLAIDQEQRVYVGGDGDFGYLAPDSTAQLRYVSLLDRLATEDRVFVDIYNTFVTDDGTYFHGFSRIYRYSLNHSSGTQTAIQVWKSDRRFPAAFMVRNTFYVHVSELGLHQMVADSLQLVPGGKRFAQQPVVAMLPFDNETILVVTRAQGSFLYDGRTFTPFITDADNFLSQNQLFNSAVLPDGTFAFATIRGGVVIMDKAGRLLQRIDETSGLLGNFVRYIYTDRHGSLWLALDNGIARVETPSPLSFYDKFSGLDSYVVSIVRHRGTLYVATGQGVYYLDAVKREFRPVAGMLARTWALLSTKGVLLAGTSDGIYRIENTTAVLIKRANESLFSYSLQHSTLDESRVYLGMNDGLAILRMIGSDGRRWTDEGRVPGINETIRTIIEDEDGTLWLGTQSLGVVRVRFGDEGSLQNPMIERFGAQHGLPKGGVSIFEVSGQKFFAMKEGLFRFDPDRGLFVPDSTLNFVGFGGSQEEYTLKEDAQGRVWINFGQETAIATRQPDGSFVAEKTAFRQISDLPSYFIYPEEDGIAWLGSEEVLIRYDPNVRKEYALDYPALIRSVILQGDSVIYGGAGFGASAEATRTFSYAQNSLRFEFSAPTFQGESETRFQTYLEGFDQHWSTWSKENRKDYTNLPQGEFRFHVRARNIYDHESAEASYAFTIVPPWYRTWWAYLLYVLVGGGLIIGLIRVRTRHLEAVQRALEKTVEERTAEIQQKVNELAIINSVGSGLAKQLNFQAIIDLVGDKIHSIFNSPTIFIAMYDSNANLVQFPYYLEVGKRIEMPPYPLGAGLSSHVIKSREPLLITEDAERRFAELGAVFVSEDEEPKKSWLGVPILVGEKVTGIISLQDVKEHAYSEADVRLLATLAANMGVALENARLFDETNRLLTETEQRAGELGVINSVQEGLVAELEMQAIYELVGDRIRDIFDAQVVTICTFDHETGIEHFNYEIEKGQRGHTESRPIDQIRGHLIESHETVLINENLAAQVAERFGIDRPEPVPGTELPKSVLFVPLVVGETVKGYVSLQNIDREHAFMDSDVRLLTTLGNSMSVALENARLFDETNRLLKETEQRNSELAVINSVQEGLVAKLDIQAIYDLVGDRIRDIFDAQVVVIRTYEPGAGRTHYQYVIEKGKRFYPDPGPIDGFHLHLIDLKKPLLLNKEFAGYVSQYGAPVATGGEAPKSAVFVPMLVGDTVKGNVSLQNIDREQAFSELDVRLLTTLANSMSVALENARLFSETNRLLAETEQRNAELAVINSVQEGLVRELDMQAIYDLVGDRIRDLFDAQVAAIATFDHEAKLEHFHYLIEKSERFYPQPRPLDKLRQHLISNRETVLIGQHSQEIADTYGLRSVPGTEDPKSLLFVPMLVGSTVRGYITLQNIDRENAFSESDVRLLTTLANSMSVALENARLFNETSRLLEETEQRNAELAVINSVQEGLAKELDIQAIYDLVGNRVCDLFDTQTVLIRSFDHQTGLEHWQYVIEKGERLHSEPRPFIWANKELIKTRQPLVINENYMETSKKYGGKGVTVGKPPKSAVFVPLIVGHTVKGSISLQNIDRENAFSADEVRLLTTLANSMSVALENARLFDETKRLLAETEQRASELAVINSVQEGLVRELDMQAIYDLVGDRICSLFKVEDQTLLIRTFDHETGLEHWEYVIEKGERLNSEPRPIIWANKELIKTCQPLIINENYVETAKKYGGKGVSVGRPPKSAVFVPMIVGDTVRGSISLQSVDREHAFNDSFVRLITTLASSMSVALENARLFNETNRLLKETEQRANELGTVNNISKALTTKLDPEALIQLVGDQMGELFRANIVYVAILHKDTNMIHFPYFFGDSSEPIPFGKGLTSKIIDSGEPLLINKDVADRTGKLGVQQLGTPASSYLGVPLPVGDEIIGVISVQSTERENRFDESDQRLLSTIAANVGIAMHNARLFEEAEQSRADAEEANEAKSAFLSTVSHELRTPLTSVLGFAKIIKKRLEERIFPVINNADNKTQRAIQQVEENIGVVVVEGERLTTLINNVLDLAKIEAGKIEWNMEKVAPAELIERATAATNSLFEGTNLRLIKDVEKSLPDITGDADKLIQVVINLISNAVKFTNKGSVTCRVRSNTDEIRVSVIDTGMGIAEEDQPKVFEKFKQVGDTLTDKPKGTGLGLSICREIVEHHSGRIWVESEIGKGSTFTFSLPTNAQSKVEEQSKMPVDFDSLVKKLKERVASASIDKNAHQQTILVVDDEAHIRELLKQELGETGYQVKEAGDGKEALELIRKDPPDLVILDVMMPKMNGFDVAAILKNDPKTMHIPIIILSIVQDKERGYRLGVDRYLTKPIDTEALFKEVEVLLSQGKSRKKIMIVDEDASTVKSLAELLTARGYSVVEANGQEMVKKAISSKPDIIIMNSVLSEKDEAVKTLRFEKGLENVLFLLFQ